MNKVLIVPKNVKGLIDLRKIEHYIRPEISNIKQISDFFLSNQRSHFNYKICIMDEEALVPFFMKIQDDFLGEMQYFKFSRVKLRELSEEEQKIFVNGYLLKDKKAQIEELEKECMRAIVYNKIGNVTEEDILKIGLDIDKIENEIKNFDISKNLDMEV